MSACWPISLKPEAAEALLQHVGIPVRDAVKDGGSMLMPGGAKLLYKQPQRTWLLYGYSHDGRDIRQCAAIIAFAMPDKGRTRC